MEASPSLSKRSLLGEEVAEDSKNCVTNVNRTGDDHDDSSQSDGSYEGEAMILEKEVVDPLKNTAGEIMRRSVTNPRMYYCGATVDPDGTGPLKTYVCGPNGALGQKQCPDCFKAQRFLEKTDMSCSSNSAGQKMSRGTVRRDLFYCGKNGCGPSSGPQCQACCETQDRILLNVAMKQKVQAPAQEYMTSSSPRTMLEREGFCCAHCCMSMARADVCCLKCCLKSEWHLCKCCVKAEWLCCKCCCASEIGMLECYFHVLRASAKLCWHWPKFACIVFLALEALFFGATFHIPGALEHIHGTTGFVWGFILVIFILCCCMPCCLLCAPMAVCVHESKIVHNRLSMFETRIESLADISIGSLKQIHDRFTNVEYKIQKTFGVIPEKIHKLETMLSPAKLVGSVEDSVSEKFDSMNHGMKALSRRASSTFTEILEDLPLLGSSTDAQRNLAEPDAEQGEVASGAASSSGR